MLGNTFLAVAKPSPSGTFFISSNLEYILRSKRESLVLEGVHEVLTLPSVSNWHWLRIHITAAFIAIFVVRVAERFPLALNERPFGTRILNTSLIKVN